MKKQFSRVLALLLAVLTAFSGTTIYALTVGKSYSYSERYLDAYYDTGSWKTADGDTHDNYGQVCLRNLKSNDEPLYCMQIYEPCDGSDATAKNIESTSVWTKEYSSTAQNGVTRVSIYGYPNFKYGYSATEAQLATQILIWEFETGKRTGYSTGCTSAFKSCFSNYPDALKCYNEILKACASHSDKPSFHGKTIELKGVGASYAQTLTDSNGLLSDFTVTSSNSKVKVSTSGNKLTVYCTEAGNLSATLVCKKKYTDTNTALALTGAGQLLFYGTLPDPVTTNVQVKLSTGNVKIKKTSEDGKVAGISFQITGGSVNKTVTTDKNGEFLVENLISGTYTITERTQNWYEPQSPKTVTVNPGETKTVTFHNALKTGDLEVIKSAEDNYKEGLKFRLTGTALSGQSVNLTATTDKDGVARFKEVPISGATPYTLTEENTPVRYVVPASQTVPIQWNKVTDRTVTNTLKKWNATVTKVDAQTGEPQGDAALAGAVYGVYEDGKLIKTYTTDSNGQFTTEDYICGDGWTIQEIEPSPGYQLDTAVYRVGAQPEHFTAPRNSLEITVKESVQSGRISIIKHADDGSTQIETPEAGAEFQIYLKSSGSYAAAKETERDTLVCDEQGFACTKALPYGTYTVHQTKGWTGREFIEDFDVFVQAHEKNYSYLINNGEVNARLKVVKVDAETGKNILLSGAGFQIYDPDGALVRQTVTYPTPTVMDTFFTDANSTFVTPEKLKYGLGYRLVEVQAPFGYVLDGTPIPFDVTEENATTQDDIRVVEVKQQNMPQKGRIEITKTGQVFARVLASGSTETASSETGAAAFYTPLYEVQNLPGAVFEVYAAEDIVTPDGTLRAAQGELVDTVTTGTDDAAQTKPLYLGRYIVKEITAPYSFARSTEEFEAELTYAGQDVQVTSTALTVENTRQTVCVTLDKAMEQDKTFGIGTNGEIQSVQFGLYAAEDIAAADGSVIPKDGLITTAGCAKDGSVTFNCDLPIGFQFYVQETETDSRYILSDTKYTFETEYKGQDTAAYTIQIDDNGKAIVNTLKRGSVQGMKVDEAKAPLAGAVIGLFAPDCTAFTKENALLTTVSAQDGSWRFSNIPMGEYILCELAAPSADYVLDTTQHHVYISEDGVALTVELQNRLLIGAVQVNKVDDKGNALDGAVFEVYQDADGNRQFDAGADALLGEMQAGENGVFTLSNLTYGGYFVHEKRAPRGFAADTGYYYFEIREDGKTVVVANQEGDGFVNTPLPKKPAPQPAAKTPKPTQAAKPKQTLSPQTGTDLYLLLAAELGAAVSTLVLLWQKRKGQIQIEKK